MGGGGGGGAAGDERPNAFLAACSAKETLTPGGTRADDGGGGGVERAGAIGGRGAALGGGGGGGAAGVAAAIPDGFLEVGGGIGGFFPSGGGFGFEVGISGADAVEAMDDGRRLFRSAEMAGFGGRGTAPGIGGAGAPGGRGAVPVGGRGGFALLLSGSERYGDSRDAPVSIPPAFLNFGIPPANSPPSCGAPPVDAPPSPPVSLLLLALLPAGTGGARPLGALTIPGTGGAAPNGDGLGPSETFPTAGADRSFVWTFFNRAPAWMSPNRAPCREHG